MTLAVAHTAKHQATGRSVNNWRAHGSGHGLI